MTQEQMRQIFRDTDFVHRSGSPEELPRRQTCYTGNAGSYQRQTDESL